MKIHIPQRRRIGRIFNVMLALLPFFTLAGCLSLSDLNSPQLDRINGLITITVASNSYYHNQGRWPASLSDLKDLASKKGLDPDFRKTYELELKAIPWEDLKDNITFKKLPDGRLSISLQNPENQITSPIKATLDIPKYNEN